MTQFSGKAGPPWIRKLPKPQRCSKRFSPRNPRKEHLGLSDSYIIQVRRFLLKALRDLEAGKPPPGLVYDSGKADFSRIRRDVAYLSSNVSWRTFSKIKVVKREKPERYP